MNIHFTDTNLFNQLQDATLAVVKVGSHLYGTNNSNSDRDYLHIYATSINELNSVVSTNHQLQYKDNNIDYNFVSLHQFIKNALNGDSPINFEVIQSQELIGTCLNFLHKHKDAFLTYTMIRAYNGLVKRDIKHYNKAITDYDKRKRLGHIVRGNLYVAAMLINKFDFDQLNLIHKSQPIDIDLNPKIVNLYLQNLQRVAEDHRKLLNEKLDNGTLGYAKNLSPAKGAEIEAEIQHLIHSKLFQDKQHILKDFDTSCFINAFENWVQY